MIDDHKYLYMNPDHIYNIVENDIKLTKPIPLKSLFLPPELKKKLTLPLQVHNTSYMYSLALIIIYCLFGKATTETVIKENIKTAVPKKSLASLDPIYPTKLYFFLLRCLLQNPLERKLIYI